MKKFLPLLLFFLLFLLFTIGASGSIESWSTLGGEYTHLVGSQRNAGFDGLIQNEYGVYLGYSGFVNDSSIGIYIRNIIQIPFRGELRFREAYSSSVMYVEVPQSSDTKILGRIMVGPIIRNNINQNNDIYLSIGPELMLYEQIYSNSFGTEYIYLFYVGVGLDLGFKHNFSEISFIQIGLNTDYKSRANTGTKLIVSPYMGIGFNY